VVEYKGHWYQFYHNQSLSGRGNLRSMCVDRMNFNDDGTIRMIVQTREGVPPVGPIPAPAPGLLKYGAATGVVANGARLEDDPAAAEGKSVHELHLANACVQFNQVNGGRNGGRAMICIHYAAMDNAKLKLLVNEIDYSFLNTPATGGWAEYKGQASLTVPLGAGTTNSIRLVGGNGGVNVDYLTVAPLP
jgi:hypothetical protein